VLGAAQGTIGFEGLQHRGEVGRVSVTGVGMRSSPDVVCTFLWTLSEAGIDVDLVEISETNVAAITGAEQLADAERAVRMAFGMTPAAEPPARTGHPAAHDRALDRDIRWGYDLRGLAASPASRGG
jgi:aspartate kinase